MGMLFRSILALHDGVALAVQRLTQDWLLGLAARAWFAATLLWFFWNAALNKLGDGGVDLSRAAAQMLGSAFFEDPIYGDASNLGADVVLMAYAGTIAEFVLPLLIVLGLATRIASVGMIVFIAVMSMVDVTAHGLTFDLSLLYNGRPEVVTAATANAVLMEFRLAWVFPLLYLALRGAGAVSLDALFRWTTGRTDDVTEAERRFAL